MIANGLVWISRALLVIASLLAMALAFIVVVDVVGRSLFNRPLRGTAELVAFSIVVIAYLQVTYAILSGGMMQVTLVLDMLPIRVRSALQAATSLLGILFFAVVAWGSIEGVADAWTRGSYEGEGALRVPTWPAKLAVLAGSMLALLAYALLAFGYVRSAITGQPAPPIISDEGQAVH